MVRLFCVAAVVLLFSIPTFAQEEFPGLEVAMGYGNVGFPTEFNLVTGEFSNTRHSGFAMHTGFNFTRWFGLENFTGVYGLGDGVTMISNIIGGKVAYRAARVTPYAVAGFGIAYLTDERTFGSSNAGTRLAVGVDIPLNDSFAWKFDVGRMSFNLDEWRSATAFSTGIVFTIR
jgi:hypothetical protein